MKTAKFSKALTIALPAEHFEQIKQITDKKCISMAEWTRAAVAVALNNIKREEELNNDE